VSYRETIARILHHCYGSFPLADSAAVFFIGLEGFAHEANSSRRLSRRRLARYLTDTSFRELNRNFAEDRGTGRRGGNSLCRNWKRGITFRRERSPDYKSGYADTLIN